jgi:hypothetical protein
MNDKVINEPTLQNNAKVHPEKKIKEKKEK